MTRDEFMTALGALERERTAGRVPVHPAPYESARCERSPGTMFSEDCEDCYRCLHCRRMTACVDCTHSEDCTACTRCSHCRHARDCSACNYVQHSVACHECNYCFGCVGLVRKDFHILNVPYERSEYFARVSQLLRALGPDRPAR